MNIRFGATLLATKTGQTEQDQRLAHFFNRLKPSVGAMIPGFTAIHETPSAFAMVVSDKIGAYDVGRLPQSLADMAPSAKIVLMEEKDLTAAEVEQTAQALSFLA